MNPQGRGNVCEIVLEARRNDLVIPAPVVGISQPRIMRKTVKRHKAQTAGQVAIICNRHSALASRHCLVRIKRETGDRAGFVAAKLPRLIGCPAPGRRKRMSSIFYYPEVEFR